MAEQLEPPICRRIRATRERLKQEAEAEGGRAAASEFSQEKVAQRVGVSLKGYRAYERTREPGYARRRQIAAALGLDSEYFEGDVATGLEDLRAELAALRGEVAQLRRESGVPPSAAARTARRRSS